jgi:tetratricopeptide (TPR) repeat protein
MKKQLNKLFYLLLLFSQTASSYPWDYVLDNNRGVELFNQNKFDDSEVLFQNAIKKNPKSNEVLYNMANNFYKKNDFSQSQSLYNQILESKDIDNNFKEKVYYNLANNYYKAGEISESTKNWKESLDYYNKALEIDPNDVQAKENYEFVKNKLENFDKKEKSNKKSNPISSVNNNKSYSNNTSSNNQEELKEYNVTETEMENILQQQKLSEETLNKYLNIHSQEKQQNNSLNKDW